MGFEDTTVRPRVTEYSDYREYLRHMTAHLKVARASFSYRAFSRRAGFSSPTALKRVAEGERNLSQEAIGQFARGLGLDEHEHESFEALVLFNQATTDEARNRQFRRLRRARSDHAVGRMEVDQYDVYGSWHHLVLCELAGLPEFREDPGWIARRLLPRIRPGEAARSLVLLERIGLLVREVAAVASKRVGSSNALRPAHAVLSAGAALRPLLIRNFHRAMLDKCADALDAIPRSRRNVTSLTVPLDPGQYERACELIGELRRQLLAMSEDKPKTDTHEIHQVLFAVFPVTGGGRGGRGGQE